MTTKTIEPEIKVQQALDARNREVEKSFNQIIQAANPLLNAFEGKKYRTCILVNHAESGRETNLISEFICNFFNLTLTKNSAGYVMLYVAYDQESITKFGARLYNRVLRQVFKHTMKTSIEDCVRVNNPGNVQQFFLNRLANGENDFVSIEVQEKETN